MGVFSRKGIPIFATFLIWGTGSGAQTLARPLFAYFISGGSVFLVTVLISGLAALRMVTGPLTGFLTDHWGRKPMAVTGAFLRGSASFAVLFVDNYIQFFVLELIGAIGVSMWQTTSQVMIADMSTPENRGKAVAARNTSMRLGQIMGPILGGGIAAIWGLQAVFVINGVSKYVVMVTTFRLIPETRPGETSEGRRQQRTSPRGMILKMMALRGFTALAITTVAVSLMNQGVFMTLFPIAAQSEAGLHEGQIGSLLSIAGVVTLVASFPNGVFVDRYGRKRSLVAGLLIAAVAAVLLAFVVRVSDRPSRCDRVRARTSDQHGSEPSVRHGPRPRERARCIPRRVDVVPKLRRVHRPAGNRNHRRDLGLRRRVLLRRRIAGWRGHGHGYRWARDEGNGDGRAGGGGIEGTVRGSSSFLFRMTRVLCHLERREESLLISCASPDSPGRRQTSPLGARRSLPAIPHDSS